MYIIRSLDFILKEITTQTGKVIRHKTTATPPSVFLTLLTTWCVVAPHGLFPSQFPPTHWRPCRTSCISVYILRYVYLATETMCNNLLVRIKFSLKTKC